MHLSLSNAALLACSVIIKLTRKWDGGIGGIGIREGGLERVKLESEGWYKRICKLSGFFPNLDFLQIFSEERNAKLRCMACGGRVRPVIDVNGAKKTGARSARALLAAKKHKCYQLFCLIFEATLLVVFHYFPLSVNQLEGVGHGTIISKETIIYPCVYVLAPPSTLPPPPAR